MKTALWVLILVFGNYLFAGNQIIEQNEPFSEEIHENTLELVSIISKIYEKHKMLGMIELCCNDQLTEIDTYRLAIILVVFFPKIHEQIENITHKITNYGTRELKRIPEKNIKHIDKTQISDFIALLNSCFNH